MNNAYDYTIKISDLLHNSGNSDTLSFTNKFSTRFPHLQDPGISGSLTLVGLNEYDLHIEIEDLVAPMKFDCDRCGKSFDGSLSIDFADTKASTEGDEDGQILRIDKKNERIDLHDRITDLLRISAPVKTLCKHCEEKGIEQEEDSSDTTTITRHY